jgi:hypothetical protein
VQRYQLPGDLRGIGGRARRLADPMRPETMPHGQPAAAFRDIYPVHSDMIPQASDTVSRMAGPGTASSRPQRKNARKAAGAALASPHMETHLPPSQKPARRAAVIVLLAIIFGMTVAWLKGNGGGVRDAVGNVSALWLLLPFLAGAAVGTHRVTAGAIAGLAATLAALVGFYFAESFALDLGPHPWLTDLSLTMGTVRYYGEPALLTGPVFGVLGFWWQQRRSVAAAALLAAAFVLKPVAWWLYGLRIGGGAAYPVPGYPALWLSEIAAGLAGFALLAKAARQGGSPA